LRVQFEASEDPPSCHCGGFIKTATISFGQAMPEAEMRRAAQQTELCDLFIAIGSSLVVYPAAGFPVLAKQKGAKMVILNRDPTELDDVADLVLNREIGPTLSQVVGTDA
jgi:NAD-dependent deacetylase